MFTIGCNENCDTLISNENDRNHTIAADDILQKAYIGFHCPVEYKSVI